ncbi:MAG: hypothetical protein ACR2QT_06240 [Woeseiaceae bacterium]
MNSLRVLIIGVLLVPIDAFAEEESVYESIAGVAIGRIFYTQSDRDYLDAQRLLPPGSRNVHADTGERVTPTTKPAESAGYIISSKGGRRVWKDGDFISASGRTTASMSFPGDVKIVRHVSHEPTAPNQEESATSESATVSSDENVESSSAE